MSKYRVEDLKDLNESKKRVMTKVVKQIEKREISKPSRRWQYNILTMILTVCIGLFLYDQYSEKNQLSSGDVQILDEDELSKYLKLAENGNKETLNRMFQDKLELDAYYVYAISKGIVLSQNAIVEQEKLTKEQFESITNDTNSMKELSKLNLSPDEFYEEYMKPNIIKFVAQKELLKDYLKKYEKSFQIHANFAIKKEALDYLTSEYKEKILYLEKKYKLSSNPSDVNSYFKQYKFGSIVAIEGDRFLVVSGELDRISHLPYTEIIEKKQNGVWFPLNGLEDKIAIGKQVNIKYTMEDDTISKGFDFAANLDEIEVIE